MEACLVRKRCGGVRVTGAYRWGGGRRREGGLHRRALCCIAEGRGRGGGHERGGGARQRGKGRRGGGEKGDGQKGKSAFERRIKVRQVSDGNIHLGSALDPAGAPPFPGPKDRSGPPLRFLPIGGLGEIGMNCMLIGNYDRYILLDAGLMFPDYDEFGMQKVLPDTSFISRWKDKIEAIVITHGHEDHIGALPWVFPALDKDTPLYASKFTMELIKRRMKEFGLWEEKRFKTFDVGARFQAGPFEIETMRVTHSIPDCIGCIFRCDDGTIVHTGDWKFDENPADGQNFDKAAFERIGEEGVTIMMSDSTNVLSPGRTTGEAEVEANLMRAVQARREGRIIVTQFASNLGRMGAVYRAAEAAGRSVCLLGASMNTYLNCAKLAGIAPFNSDDLIDPSEIEDYPPEKLLIITTGSQGESLAQLNQAAVGASRYLKLETTDTLLYSAKCIPGNDKKVMDMMNNISRAGTNVVMGRDAGLHTSGHAYAEEQRELIKFVNPQHFMPVHGEYTFLQAHAEVARSAGVQHTSVIHDGQMLGVYNLRNRREVSRTSATLLGEVNFRCFYNDGGTGTGDDLEMKLRERLNIADSGIVIASVEIRRGKARTLSDFHVTLVTRALFVNQGKYTGEIKRRIEKTLGGLDSGMRLREIEKEVQKAVRNACRQILKKRPDVVVFVHEVMNLDAARNRRRYVKEEKEASNKDPSPRERRRANATDNKKVDENISTWAPTAASASVKGTGSVDSDGRSLFPNDRSKMSETEYP